LAIKIILVLGVMAAAVPLLQGQGARHLAIRRILLMLFMTFAAASIFRPDLWTRLANLVGVGRGSDLVLYSLVIAFLGFVMTSYVRNRAIELQLTRLARRIALAEADPPTAGRRGGGAA
jgi:hypothetical protein